MIFAEFFQQIKTTERKVFLMEFIDRLNDLCERKGISKRKLERDAGLGIGSTSKWSQYRPNQASLKKVADYFGVSVDYLLGQSEYLSEQDALIAKWKEQFDESALAEDVKKIEAGIRLPVLGTVVAGIPIEAIEDQEVDEWEEIPEILARKGGGR